MRKQLKFMLLLVILSGFEVTGQEPKSTAVESNSAQKIEKDGYTLYQKSPEDALPTFKNVAKLYAYQKDYKKAGLTYLNIAGIYDENLGKPDSALIYAHESLQIWQEANDSLQQANLYKYIGLLEGKLGQFEKGKTAIQKAMKLYQILEFEEGLNVAKFNLANVYFQEKDYTNSKNLFQETINFWKEKGDAGRVFINNLFGIELYAAMNDAEGVKHLIDENKTLAPDAKLNDYLKRKFEELVAKYGK
ncbi:MAG: tetratricopeptide repeat protein [Saprospiraceae bacterium]